MLNHHPKSCYTCFTIIPNVISVQQCVVDLLC